MRHYERRRRDAERAGVSVRGHDAEDRRAQRGRGEARPQVHPSEACGHLRQRGRGAGSRRPHPGGAPEPPRSAPVHVPARGGVRHRLQLRLEEHARPQLPLRGEAARRRDLDAPGGALARSARGRRLCRPLRRARRRRRGEEDQHARSTGSPGAGAELRPSGARRGHARLDVSAAQEQRGVPGPQPAAREPLRRQRRPPHLRGRGEAAAPAELRPGDHDRARGARRARRWRRPRLLCRGRRLPGVRRLARAGESGPGCVVARSQDGGPRDHRAAAAQARGRRFGGVGAAAGGHPRGGRVAPASRHGSRHPRRKHGSHRRRQAPGGLGEGEVGPVLRPAGRLRRGHGQDDGSEVQAESDLVPRPADHRPPARRLPHGPEPRGGRRRPVRRGLRLPGLHDRRRLGHARPGRAEPVA